MIRNPPKDSIGDFWGPSLYYVFVMLGMYSLVVRLQVT